MTSGCAATGVSGIAVTLGNLSTVTLDDGTFSLPVPIGETLGTAWRASASGYMTSVVRFTAPNLIPMTTEIRYGELLDVHGMALANGQGAIFGRVITAGAARPGITATSSPPSTYVTHYDAASALAWEQDATGTAGAFWISGAPVGDVAVTLAPGTLAAVTVPVEELAITFATFDIP